MAILPTQSAMLDVLGLLLQAWQDKVDLHGWMIIKSVRRSGPAVYAALDRLEDAGWVSSSWEVLPAGQSRPRRRYYRLTASGAQAAQERITVAAASPGLRLRPQPGMGMGVLARPRPIG